MRAYLKKLVVNGLWKSATRILANDKPTVIAVTGAVGKTTTKDAIYHLLEGNFKKPVRKAEGNMNTEFGIPLAVAGITKVPRNPWQWLITYIRLRLRDTSGVKGGLLILEFSSDKAGDIAFLASKIPVDAAVFTRFTLAHSGHTIDDVTKEKLSLLSGLTKKGIIIANADDPEQASVINDARTISYGLNKGSVQATKVTLKEEGATATLSYGGKQVSLKTKLVAEHQLQSILAAVAVGVSLDIPLTKLADKAATFTAPNGRMRLIKGRKQMTIIDDTYNSSPAAAFEAVTTLARLAGTRRSVAIMGNMNELGGNTVTAHIELGRQVANANIGYFIAVGPNAKRMIRGAREAGLPDAHLIDFLKPEKLMAHLDALIQSNDCILVKASQNGMRLERVVKKLMAEPSKAKTLLVRQD